MRNNHEREILFRGKRIDGEWVYGSIYQGIHDGEKVFSIIVDGEAITDNSLPDYIAATFNHSEFIPVYPNTIGQLRYKNEHGKYFDGDVYRHAGYGYEVVSDLCQIQLALMSGHNNDIGSIVGNIHDNPNLITKP